MYVKSAAPGVDAEAADPDVELPVELSCGHFLLRTNGIDTNGVAAKSAEV